MLVKFEFQQEELSMKTMFKTAVSQCKYSQAGQIKVYVISNIAPNRLKYIDEVCSNLDDGRYRIFKPHCFNQYNEDNTKIEFEAFFKDQQEIDNADICLVLMPLYGRDCAAEIGYSQGMGKCVVAYVKQMSTNQENDWLNDWMVKGFLDYIVTDDLAAYQKLSSDQFIKRHEEYINRKMVHLIKNQNSLDIKLEELMIEKST
ncbi:MAG: hypothetical protein AB1390_09325 [Nitrospirota bacterium]